MDKKEIYPLRSGYKRTAPPEVLAAVREKQTSWDGENWIALRMHIVMALPEGAREDLDIWTFSHIIQFFHTLKNPAALRDGAKSDTHKGIISRATLSVVQTDKVSFSSPSISLQQTLGKPAAKTTDAADTTPVTKQQLADHAGCGDRVIRNALTNCQRVFDGAGQLGHRWRYCDALPILKAVDSGCLKGIVWPNSATQLNTKKHSNKIPAKSLRR